MIIMIYYVDAHAHMILVRGRRIVLQSRIYKLKINHKQTQDNSCFALVFISSNSQDNKAWL